MGNRIDLNDFHSDKEPRIHRYVTAKQLAGYLGVKTQSIYRWVKNKSLTPVHIGARVKRFDLTQVLMWIQFYQRQPKNKKPH